MPAIPNDILLLSSSQYKEPSGFIFGKTFSKGFHQSSNYLKGKGNLKKIPNLKPLKTNMIKYMEYNSPISYIHSHEILFGKNINLKKYLLMIMLKSLMDYQLQRN